MSSYAGYPSSTDGWQLAKRVVKKSIDLNTEAKWRHLGLGARRTRKRERQRESLNYQMDMHRSIERLLGFEFRPRYSRLSDNGLQSAYLYFIVIRDWNSDGSLCQLFLHDNMATPLSYFMKTVFRKNCTYLFSGEDTKFTQQLPRPASRRHRPEICLQFLPWTLSQRTTPEPL